MISNNTGSTTKFRVESIDILRGLVMLIMAIDHVRDFFHVTHADPTNLSTTTPFLFFTRCITHFCAPTFVFLSGVSAYLAGLRRTSKELATFLLKRGVWLIVVELTLITFAGTLNPYFNVFVLQVIWAIGASMILLGLLIRLRLSTFMIAIIGGFIFLEHNIFDVMHISLINDTTLGNLLLSGHGFNTYRAIGPNHGVLIAYAILPWTSVMFLGYAYGQIYNKTFNAGKRKKILLRSGVSMLVIFFLFRYFNIYGDPASWSVQNTTTLSIISFFNVTKYPCSLLYLCITVGTALLMLAWIEDLSNKFTSLLIIYGNVPFFYYICHWYLLRFFTVILFFVQGFTSRQIASAKQPLYFHPEGLGFNLLGVFIIWLIVITILYYPCRWYGKYKKSHTQWWLSYL